MAMAVNAPGRPSRSENEPELLRGSIQAHDCVVVEADTPQVARPPSTSSTRKKKKRRTGPRRIGNHLFDDDSNKEFFLQCMSDLNVFRSAYKNRSAWAVVADKLSAYYKQTITARFAQEKGDFIMKLAKGIHDRTHTDSGKDSGAAPWFDLASPMLSEWVALQKRKELSAKVKAKNDAAKTKAKEAADNLQAIVEAWKAASKDAKEAAKAAKAASEAAKDAKKDAARASDGRGTQEEALKASQLAKEATALMQRAKRNAAALKAKADKAKELASDARQAKRDQDKAAIKAHKVSLRVRQESAILMSHGVHRTATEEGARARALMKGDTSLPAYTQFKQGDRKVLFAHMDEPLPIKEYLSTMGKATKAGYRPPHQEWTTFDDRRKQRRVAIEAVENALDGDIDSVVAKVQRLVQVFSKATEEKSADSNGVSSGGAVTTGRGGATSSPLTTPRSGPPHTSESSPRMVPAAPTPASAPTPSPAVSPACTPHPTRCAEPTSGAATPSTPSSSNPQREWLVPMQATVAVMQGAFQFGQGTASSEFTLASPTVSYAPGAYATPPAAQYHGPFNTSSSPLSARRTPSTQHTPAASRNPARKRRREG